MSFFIKNYIDNMNEDDIVLFGEKNNITVDNDEASILLKHLKNNWEELLYGDPLPIIRTLQDEIGKTKCVEIEELLLFYKDKYKNYL